MLKKLLSRDSSLQPLKIFDFYPNINKVILPLIDPDSRFILFFNAKAGCTFASKWFFEQTGKLTEALEYDNWIHKYRINVYYKSPEYKHDLNRALTNKAKFIKLVRDPFQRAVSSYLHCIRFNLSNKEISMFLERLIDDKNTFSFEEFVDYLASINIYTCNPHYRAQTSFLEIKNRLEFDKIIKLENSIQEFYKLEKKLDLKRTDLLQLSDSRHNVYKSEHKDNYCGDREFNKSDRTINHYRDFYNDHSLGQIAKIYSRDFSNYGYPTGLS